MEIDYELVDKIFLDKLKEDYISLCQEIYRIKNYYGRDILSFPDHIREDYEASYDFVIAMEQLFKYYMTKEKAEMLEQKGTDIRYGKSA